MPVFNAIPEARFIASTNLILSSAAKQVVDLPCGYTSRGIKLQKSNIRYFGFDLPAVTSVVGTAVKEIIGENNSIKYCPVDATNYNSLRQALGDIRAEQVRSIVSDYAGKVSKTTLFNNRFYDPDQEKVKQFVSDMGFDLVHRYLIILLCYSFGSSLI